MYICCNASFTQLPNSGYMQPTDALSDVIQPFFAWAGSGFAATLNSTAGQVIRPACVKLPG